MMQSPELKTKLADPATRDQALLQIGEWVRDSVLLFGGDASLAYRLSFAMVEGIQASHEGRKPSLGFVR